MKMKLRKSMLAGSAAAALFSGAAMAQDKPFNVYVGYSAGGGYDVYGRIVRALHRQASFPATRTSSSTTCRARAPAPRQLALQRRAQGRHHHRHVRARHRLRHAARPAGRAIRRHQVQLDRQRQRRSQRLRRLAHERHHQVREVSTKELVMGGTGGSADTDQFPQVFNSMLGTKMKVVAGYPGGNDINLAMERGEVTGRCGWSWSSVVSTQPNWLKEKKINVSCSFAREASRPAGRSDDHGLRQERRAEGQMFRLVFARQVMGRPFVGAAGHPGRPRRRAAQGLHGHHEGQGAARGGRQGQTGDHAGVGRRRAEARERGLFDASRSGEAHGSRRSAELEGPGETGALSHDGPKRST